MNRENIFCKQINSVIPDSSVDQDLNKSEDNLSLSQNHFDNLRPVSPNIEDKYAIDKFNNYLETELRALNLSFSPVAPESIKIYRYDDFEKIKSELGRRESLIAGGTCLGPDQEIVLKMTMSSEQYHGLLHGMVKRFLANQDSYQTSTGISPRKNEAIGFSNGLAEVLAVEILNKHRDELLTNLPSLNINSSQAQMAKSNFFRNITAEGAFVSSLIKKISARSGAGTEEAWQSLKKEFLLGGLESCQVIENVFGKGSLEILAMRGQGSDIDASVYRYFMSDNEEERDRLKEKLLPPGLDVRVAA